MRIFFELLWELFLKYKDGVQLSGIATNRTVRLVKDFNKVITNDKDEKQFFL